MDNYEFNDVDLIDNFANLDIKSEDKILDFISFCESKIDWKEATERLEIQEETEINHEELELEI